MTIMKRYLPGLILSVLITGTVFAQSVDERNLFRLAQQYERAADHRNAVRIFEELHGINPKNFDYFDGLRRNLVRLREFERAIELTERRLERYPGDISLMSVLGGMFYNKGEHDKGLLLWEDLLRQNRGNPDAYKEVASRMVENRLVENAIEVYKRGRNEIGQPHFFATDLAFLYASSMNFRDATREYLLHLEHSPRQLNFIQSRISTYILTRDEGVRHAVDVAEERVRDKPEHVELLRLLAWLYREDNNYAKALDVIRRIDRLRIAEGEELYSFGRRAFNDQEYLIAVSVFEEILEKFHEYSDTPDVHLMHARSLEELIRLDIKYGEEEIPFTPPFDEKLVAEMRSNYDSILDLYGEIAAKFSGTAAAVHALHRIGLLRLEWFFDLDGALNTLQKVVDLQSRGTIFTETLSLIGDIYIMKGRFNEAEEIFDKLLNLPGIRDDYRDEAKFRKTEIAYFSGEFQNALELLSELTDNPSSPFANDAIALKMFITENRNPSTRGVQSEEPSLLYARAMHFKRQQRYSESIAILLEIAEEYSDALLVDDALMKAGDMYFTIRRFDDALRTYDKIGEGHEESILRDLALLRRGEVYHYGKGNIERAVEVYEKLIAEFPRSIYTDEARKRIRILRGERL